MTEKINNNRPYTYDVDAVHTAIRVWKEGGYLSFAWRYLVLLHVAEVAQDSDQLSTAALLALAQQPSKNGNELQFVHTLSSTLKNNALLPYYAETKCADSKSANFGKDIVLEQVLKHVVTLNKNKAEITTLSVEANSFITAFLERLAVDIVADSKMYGFWLQQGAVMVQEGFNLDSIVGLQFQFDLLRRLIKQVALLVVRLTPEQLAQFEPIFFRQMTELQKHEQLSSRLTQALEQLCSEYITTHSQNAQV